MKCKKPARHFGGGFNLSLLPQGRFTGSLVGKGAGHGFQILFECQGFEDALLDLVGAGGQQVDGAASGEALPFNNSFRADSQVDVPVYTPKDEPFLYTPCGALQDYKESKIKGLGKLAMSPVKYG